MLSSVFSIHVQSRIELGKLLWYGFFELLLDRLLYVIVKAFFFFFFLLRGFLNSSYTPSSSSYTFSSPEITSSSPEIFSSISTLSVDGVFESTFLSEEDNY
jgi:hypothetical protein